MPDRSRNTANLKRAAIFTQGVGGRLMAAFVGIAAFAALAAIAGIFATQQIGLRLKSVDERATPTLTAIDLSRAAERIIAAAPALLASDKQAERDQVETRISLDITHLESALAELEKNGPPALPLVDIEPVVASLRDNLSELAIIAEQRWLTSEKLDARRQELFSIREEVQRLLTPWLAVVDGEIGLLVAEPANGAGRTDLTASLNLQRNVEAAQRQASAVGDILAEASTTRDRDRLPILAFQIGLGLRGLDRIAAELPQSLRSLYLEQVSALRQLASAPDAITDIRSQELGLLQEGREWLAAIEQVAAELTTAVDRLGQATKDEIGQAISDALLVQSLSRSVLIALAVMSILTSILIMWRYVGRSIVRRLSSLTGETLAIANGNLHRPVIADGDDEIAEMSRAIEVFRQNAIELARLLEERKAATTELERLVGERTQDLSESLRQQEEQRRALESANTFKSRFLAAASHDLRQPLHALNLFVARLIDMKDPGERAQTIAQIDAAVSSMNDLLNNLLDMSKLEAGQLEPSLAVFPIGNLLSRIESTFSDQAQAQGLKFAVVQNSAWVRSDPVLLERILLNLASNALQYTAKGGVVVGCRHQGETLKLDVCDTGPGLSVEQQKTVFNEFVQLGGAGRRAGLGLGLTIVDRLARLLGHDIELESRLGVGSRFSVAVPMAEPVALPADVRGASQLDADRIRDKLILVIDDDALALTGMSDILNGWGGHVITARSESEAQSALEAVPGEPDLVVSDLHLAGGTSGIDAIRNLRTRATGPVPAFLVSGDTSPERQREANANGFDLLHKPVSPIRLRAMINHALGAGPKQR